MFLNGVWPSSVGDISHGYKDNDTEIKKFTLGIKYQYCFADPSFKNKGDYLSNDYSKPNV